MKKILFWLPRILSICLLFLNFILAFDVYLEDWTLGEKNIGFIIHLIPFFIILTSLIIAWKRELSGSLIFIALGMIMLIYILLFRIEMWLSLFIISLPLIIIGLLFLLNYFLFTRKKEKITFKE